MATNIGLEIGGQMDMEAPPVHGCPFERHAFGEKSTKMNWKYEAKRIAAAFGAEGRCMFKDTEAGKQLLRDGKEWIEVNQNGDVWEFRFMYIDHLTRIDIRNRDNLKAMLTLDHRGEIVNLWKHGLESRLVKPLVNIGILTDEIEKALGTTVTATERLEWAMEYEARLKPAKYPALLPLSKLN